VNAATDYPALRALVAGNPAATAELESFLELRGVVTVLQAQVTALKAQLSALQTNSQTSSKPPSSDKFNPNKPSPRSLRERSGLKPGGQPGHKGHSLELSASPDEVIHHLPPSHCPECAAPLDQAEVALDAAGQPVVERRQVIELTPARPRRIEHRVASVICPDCGAVVGGCFPEGVHGPVCYGPSVQAMVVFLSVGQLLPSHRLVEVMKELCECPMSPGSVAPMIRRCAAQAQPVMVAIKEAILAAPVCGFDETGTSLNGKNIWLHTASTELFTALHMHAKRGVEGMLAGGILPHYTGRAIHDFFSSYFTLLLVCLHGLCNAHHLRDLRDLWEREEQEWAAMMMDFLCGVKKAVDAAKARNEILSEEQFIEFHKLYQEILDEGYRTNPEPPAKPPGQRGRSARGKSLNLLDRFDKHRDEILAFMRGDVPFDNNQAERDLRMMKTRQKISGCFRARDMSEAFVTIRSILSTAAKHSVGAAAAIEVLLGPSPTLEKLVSSS
jgi:transposase